MRPTAAAVFRTKSGSHQTPRWRKRDSNRGALPVSEWLFSRWTGNHEVGEEDDLMRRTSRGLTVRISFPLALSPRRTVDAGPGDVRLHFAAAALTVARLI